MIVAIDPGIQLLLRIVEMKNSNPLDADHLVEFAEGAVVTLLGANIIASRERVCGVETDAQPVACASGVYDLTDLLETIANVRSLAGGDFEGHFGAIAGARLVNLVERLCDCLDPGQFVGDAVTTGMCE